jgi:hypothetical protein
MDKAQSQSQIGPLSRTHLFTVRLWLEELSEGQTEWRGEVQYVVSGEMRYFRDRPALVEALQEMLPAQQGSSSAVQQHETNEGEDPC